MRLDSAIPGRIRGKVSEVLGAAPALPLRFKDASHLSLRCSSYERLPFLLGLANRMRPGDWFRLLGREWS